MKKKLCFLIGYPVKHSLSPGMHKIAFKELGLTDWNYDTREIKDEKGLKGFVEEVIEKKYVGFNVTIPYKQAIIKYINTTKSSAQRIGAVNTVLNRDDGILEGLNTDWKGFKDDLKDCLGFDPPYKTCLVLGAGGAGRAVVQGLSTAGTILIYDPDNTKVKDVIGDFRTDTGVIIREIDNIDSVLEKVDLIVNASPVGMKPGSPVITLKAKNFKKELKIYDVVYNRKTELIKEAQGLGLKACGGIGMLLGQGVEALKWWIYSQYPDKGLADIPHEVKKKMKSYLEKEVAKSD